MSLDLSFPEPVAQLTLCCLLSPTGQTAKSTSEREILLANEGCWLTSQDLQSVIMYAGCLTIETVVS